MQTRHAHHAPAAIAAVLLASLACQTLQSIPAEHPPVVQSLSYADCNLTSWLTPSARLTRDETNELGTRLCEYTITLVNKHPSQPILPVFYQLHSDGYQNVHEHVWDDLPPIQPGASYEWWGNVYSYTDPDVSLPVAQVGVAFVGLKNDYGTCTALKNEPDVLKTLSSPLPEAPCQLTGVQREPGLSLPWIGWPLARASR